MDSQDWEPPSEAEMKLIEARRERSDKISKLMSSYLLKGYKMLGTVCPTCETILLRDRQGTDYCVACSELNSDADKDSPVTSQTAAMSMAREQELATSAASSAQVNGKLNGASGALATKLSPRTQTVHDRSSANLEDTTQTLSMSSIDVQSWPAHPYALRQKNATSARPVVSIKTENFISSDGETDSDSGLHSGEIAAAAVTTPRTHSLSGSQKSGGQQEQRSVSTASTSASSPSAAITRLCEKVEWASRELKDARSVEYSIQLCQLIKTAAEAVVAVRTARI